MRKEDSNTKFVTIYDVKCPFKIETCKDSEIYFTYSRGKKQPTDNVPNEAQTLDLIVSDIKSSVKNMFKELKKMMFKEVKERIKVMSHQIDINNEKLF